MRHFKTHIGWLFLWIFLVPQLNNVLHYWIIKHDYTQEHNTKTELLNKNNVHYCDQTLFKIPSMWLLLYDFDFQNFITVLPQCEEELLHKFVKIYFIGYYLRGPPGSVFNQSIKSTLSTIYLKITI